LIRTVKIIRASYRALAAWTMLALSKAIDVVFPAVSD